MFILFITGLRVSNLLKLQVRHIVQFIEKHSFDVELIKKRKKIPQTFPIPIIALTFFTELLPFFKTVIQNKKDDQYLLQQDDKHKNNSHTHVMTREYLDKRLNNILKHVSTKTNKNIKTHSFRIGLTTALIETVGVHAASIVMAHESINTTLLYERRALNMNEITKSQTLAHKYIFSIDKLRRRKQEYKARRRHLIKTKRLIRAQGSVTL